MHRLQKSFKAKLSSTLLFLSLLKLKSMRLTEPMQKIAGIQYSTGAECTVSSLGSALILLVRHFTSPHHSLRIPLREYLPRFSLIVPVKMMRVRRFGNNRRTRFRGRCVPRRPVSTRCAKNITSSAQGNRE
jgi:hypothetical protein